MCPHIHGLDGLRWVQVISGANLSKSECGVLGLPGTSIRPLEIKVLFWHTGQLQNDKLPETNWLSCGYKLAGPRGPKTCWHGVLDIVNTMTSRTTTLHCFSCFEVFLQPTYKSTAVPVTNFAPTSFKCTPPNMLTPSIPKKQKLTYSANTQICYRAKFCDVAQVYPHQPCNKFIQHCTFLR